MMAQATTILTPTVLGFSAGGPLGPTIGGPPPAGGPGSHCRWSPDGLVTAS
jgi:hypothetical protein